MGDKARSKDSSMRDDAARASLTGESFEDDAAAGGASDAAEGCAKASPAAKTRRLCIACAAALIAVLAALQAVSFSVRSVDANNRLSFGDVGIQAVETMRGPSGEEVAVPDEPVAVGIEGEHSRIVRVRNTSSHPVFVRVSLHMQGTDEHGAASNADDLASYTIGDPAWSYRDGWYYYDAVLGAGETSAPVITGLSIDADGAQERYRGGTLDFTVDAVAVQSENNGPSVFEAEGWPQKEGR